MEAPKYWKGLKRVNEQARQVGNWPTRAFRRTSILLSEHPLETAFSEPERNQRRCKMYAKDVGGRQRDTETEQGEGTQGEENLALLLWAGLCPIGGGGGRSQMRKACGSTAGCYSAEFSIFLRGLSKTYGDEGWRQIQRFLRAPRSTPILGPCRCHPRPWVGALFVGGPGLSSPHGGSRAPGNPVVWQGVLRGIDRGAGKVAWRSAVRRFHVEDVGSPRPRAAEQC